MNALEFLQPAIKWNDYVETPDQFLQLLENAKIVKHIPVRQLGLAKIVIVNKGKETK